LATREDDIIGSYPSPHAWAMARVGEYMQLWAMAESALNRTIQAALSLSELQEIIITSELLAPTKIKIAIAAVHISDVPKEDRLQYLKKLKEFLQLSGDRNMVAHRAFFVSKEEGKKTVNFYLFRLRVGPLDGKKISWSNGEFERKYAQLIRIRDKLEELPPLVANIKTSRLLAEQLNAFGSFEPNGVNYLRAFSNLASSPPPKSPGENHKDATARKPTSAAKKEG
jgi:hypothetical protein